MSSQTINSTSPISTPTISIRAPDNTPVQTPTASSSTPLLLAQKSAHLATLFSVLGVADTSALEEVLLTPTFEYTEFDDKSSTESQASESESEDEDEDVFAVRIDDRRRS